MSELKTRLTAWSNARNFIATGSASVSQRDKATFEALSNIEIIVTSGHDNALILRSTGDTDGDSNVHDLYFMASGSDHYSRVLSATWITGLQVSGVSGQLFADTVSLTNQAWHKTFLEVSPGNNFIAEISVDLYGVERIGIVPTTVANNLNTLSWRSV